MDEATDPWGVKAERVEMSVALLVVVLLILFHHHHHCPYRSYPPRKNRLHSKENDRFFLTIIADQKRRATASAASKSDGR